MVLLPPVVTGNVALLENNVGALQRGIHRILDVQVVARPAGIDGDPGAERDPTDQAEHKPSVHLIRWDS